MTLTEKLLASRFVDIVRNEQRIDRAAFADLREVLRALAVAWRGQQLVDKRAVQEMFAVVDITRGIADKLRDVDPQRCESLDAARMDLDALVLECLAD